MAVVGNVPLPLPLPLELGVPLDWRLFALTLSMVVIATTGERRAAGPAAARATALSPALKQTERAYVHRRWTLRGLLVIGQVTLSVGLVVTALLFVRNLSLARTSSPGFDTARTVVAQLGLVESRYTPETRVAFLQQAVERVEALPGVERAAFAFGMPLSIRHGRTSGARLTIAGEPATSGVLGVAGPRTSSVPDTSTPSASPAGRVATSPRRTPSARRRWRSSTRRSSADISADARRSACT